MIDSEEIRSRIEHYAKNIFSVFTVSWESLTANKFEFMNQLRVSTNVIDQWPYHEFERYIKLLNEKNEAEKKHQNEQDNNKNMPNMSSMNNLAKNFNPSNFKLPQFKTPSF